MPPYSSSSPLFRRSLDPTKLQTLVPGALAIVLVGYAEALGGAKAAAMQGGGDIDANQRLHAS